MDYSDLLQGFTSTEPEETLTPQTPEQEDESRLESEIRGSFTDRKLINRAITTFNCIAAARGSLYLLARLGLPALATGTVGGVLIVAALGDALARVSINQGKPSIDGNFLAALVRTVGAGAAVWLSLDEQREISSATDSGSEQFVQEVKDFEVRDTAPPFWQTPWLGVVPVLVLMGILVIVGVRKNDRWRY
ncbi:MAG: hypothetical protein WA919_03600 [Coleofasciculaceae cyanobacterium]